MLSRSTNLPRTCKEAAFHDQPRTPGPLCRRGPRIGARPILVTSLTRRHFTPEGKIRSDLGPYADAVKAVAAEKKVPVIDLHARSIELLERLGPQASAEFNPTPKEEAKAAAADKTHLSPKGSAVFGALVADELVKVEPALAPYFRSP